MTDLDRLAMSRVSAMVRPWLQQLSPLEQAELCGTWALMVCIQHGQSDDEIATMFDVMKERMLRQAPTFREALKIVAGLDYHPMGDEQH